MNCSPSVSLILTLSIAWAVTSHAQRPVTAKQYEQHLEHIRAQLSSDLPRDQKHWTLEAMCITPWPEELVPQVVDTVKQVLHSETAAWVANAMSNLANRYPREAASLTPEIAKGLAAADPGEKVKLLLALRALGPGSSEASEQIEQLFQDRSPIVRIHAASALGRVQPANRRATLLLLGKLSDESEHIRWAAAVAIAHSDLGDRRLIDRLQILLSDHDVRVRVAAASALWAIEKDRQSVLPVLLNSLSEPHRPMATAFVYPSNGGDSHRQLAIVTLAKLLPSDSDLIFPAIVRQLDEASNDLDNQHIAYVGLVALQTLSAQSPLPRVVASQIVEITSRDSGYQQRYGDLIAQPLRRVQAATR